MNSKILAKSVSELSPQIGMIFKYVSHDLNKEIFGVSPINENPKEGIQKVEITFKNNGLDLYNIYLEWEYEPFPEKSIKRINNESFESLEKGKLISFFVELPLSKFQNTTDSLNINIDATDGNGIRRSYTATVRVSKTGLEVMDKSGIQNFSPPKASYLIKFWSYTLKENKLSESDIWL